MNNLNVFSISYCVLHMDHVIPFISGLVKLILTLSKFGISLRGNTDSLLSIDLGFLITKPRTWER